MYAVMAATKLQRERLKSIEAKPEAVQDFNRYAQDYFKKVNQRERSTVPACWLTLGCRPCSSSLSDRGTNQTETGTLLGSGQVRACITSVLCDIHAGKTSATNLLTRRTTGSTGLAAALRTPRTSQSATVSSFVLIGVFASAYVEFAAGTWYLAPDYVDTPPSEWSAVTVQFSV